MSEIRESIFNVRTALASNPDAGPAPDRPASAVMEDGLRCRVDGPDGWAVVTDMPAAVGGGAVAPSPAWLVRAAWASCVATAIAMRAAELNVALMNLEVTAESETDMRGLLAVGNGIAPGPTRVRLRVRLDADGVDAGQLEELVRWADAHSPVSDALRRAVPVELEVAVG